LFDELVAFDLEVFGILIEGWVLEGSGFGVKVMVLM
jgi:hypothetical protein